MAQTPPPDLTDAEIAELKRLDAWCGATKPPWGFGEGWGPDDARMYVCIENLSDVTGTGHIGNVFSPADARLLVAARNAIPRLLAERERLRGALERIHDLTSRAGGEWRIADAALKGEG